ncbi:hypothetical protein F5Y17DRAFT_36987 [Xylariaceae sp. FL0594]|nr:hypothetical protein F5Y17DRAFT_36987 [Xylariaceae sp. FL0594]
MAAAPGSGGDANSVPGAPAGPSTPSDRPSQPSYVDLADPYYKNSVWTNDPKELELDVYFDPLKPNLGDQFGLRNLRPVIKDTRRESFLLMDAGGRFYTWNPDDGLLYRVLQNPLQPKDAAIKMMNGFDTREVEQMVNPALSR